ncbi:hypothetical protein [Sphingomonas sp. DBB INV C78]|uniref:hypothetical protein n=1 Tax=Sphingomonas sp. DBB INV C78 TaxID=3349434 RepID=UPI0036D31E69
MNKVPGIDENCDLVHPRRLRAICIEIGDAGANIDQLEPLKAGLCAHCREKALANFAELFRAQRLRHSSRISSKVQCVRCPVAHRAMALEPYLGRAIQVDDALAIDHVPLDDIVLVPKPAAQRISGRANDRFRAVELVRP